MMTFTSKEKSDKSFLLILNDNLLKIICSFLDSKNLIILGETCKGLNKLISENIFWQKIYFNKFNIFFYLITKAHCKSSKIRRNILQLKKLRI